MNPTVLLTVTILRVLVSTTSFGVVLGAGDNRAVSGKFDFTSQFDNLDCGER